MVLAGAVATAVAVAVVVSGGGLVDRASPTTAVEDPVVAGPSEDALDDLPRGEPPASPVATDPSCSEGPELGCFLWTIEEADRERVGAADMRHFSVARLGRGRLVTRVHPTGRVTAYDLRAGIEVWSAPGERECRTARSLQVVDDVVLHHDEEALVARDLVTGEERWRNPELVNFGVRQAEPAGGQPPPRGSPRRVLVRQSDPARSRLGGRRRSHRGAALALQR